MLLAGPFARYSGGACGVERSVCRRYSSRIRPFHACAQLRKKRCSPVKPSITGERASAERHLVGAPRDGEPAQVADVLVQRDESVDAGAGNRAVAVELLDERLALWRRTPVRRRPSTSSAPRRAPSMRRPRSSKPWPSSCPTMAPMRAIVGGIVGLGVEERRLQHRGRHHDFVQHRVVVGVDRLRRHQPLAVRVRARDRRLSLYSPSNWRARCTLPKRSSGLMTSPR